MATTVEPPATTRLRNDCTPRATPRKANVTPTKATATTSMASTAAGANEATTATITPRLRHSSTVAAPDDRHRLVGVRRERGRPGDPGEYPGHPAVDDERLEVAPREVVPDEREEKVRDPRGERRGAGTERADEAHDAEHPGDDGNDHADFQDDAHRPRGDEARQAEDCERRRGRSRRLGPPVRRPAEVGRDEVERLRDRQVPADEGKMADEEQP